MSHPFKRYCFSLAERLGKHISEILTLSSKTISEWMAYDLTNDEEWRKEYSEEIELRQQQQMSNEEKAKLFKQLLGGI